SRTSASRSGVRLTPSIIASSCSRTWEPGASSLSITLRRRAEYTRSVDFCRTGLASGTPIGVVSSIAGFAVLDMRTRTRPELIDLKGWNLTLLSRRMRTRVRSRLAHDGFARAGRRDVALRFDVQEA